MSSRTARADLAVRADLARRRRGRASRPRASSSASSSASSRDADELELISLIVTGARDEAVARAIGRLVDAFDVSRECEDVRALVDALEGTWRLVHSTKTEFDASAPLGRRADATTPGLEALFSILFDDEKKREMRRTGSRRARRRFSARCCKS